jgi:RHS repeat-associated protein
MPHAVTSTSDGKSYTYDCNGNMIADGDRTFFWDADNKPAAITRTGVGTTTFAYSGDGARVKKQTGANVIRYVGGYEDHVTDGVPVKHILAGGLHIATRVSAGPNAGTYYAHGDHLGSLNVLTNASGQEVQRLTYLPFGETLSNTGTVDFLQHRYTGQEQDPETGLYFYHARYYNPVLGRFLSPDSIVPGAGNPQSLNRYSYVTNNPVNLTDPSGHFSLGGFLGSIGSIIAGVAVGVLAGGWGASPIVAGMLGGAAAGAVNSAVNGGNLGANILAGAAFGGFAGGVGGPLSQALGGGLQGAVGSGALLGAAFGGIGASIAGKNIAAGMLGGAVSGALLAAAMYGGNKAFEGNGSPALEGGGNPPGQAGVTAQGQSTPAYVSDPGVARELDRAWLESNPFAPDVPRGTPGSLKVEQGGWIVRDWRDLSMGSFEVLRVAPGTRDSLPTIAGTRPSPAFGILEGWFHTHPIYCSRGVRIRT